ncbi:MAG: hypothetical protein CMK36_08555 [Porticoccaceae bacterium]|nr:hypothetical protein [Porticoccaceae bacterium]
MSLLVKKTKKAMLSKQSEVSLSHDSTPATQIITNTKVHASVEVNEVFTSGFVFFARACLIESTKNQTSDILAIY